MRLSAKAISLLRQLEAGPKLRGHWDFSGMRLPATLRKAGLIEVCDHPSVTDRRTGHPAEAYRLTDAGRAELRRVTSPT